MQREFCVYHINTIMLPSPSTLGEFLPSNHCMGLMIGQAHVAIATGSSHSVHFPPSTTVPDKSEKKNHSAYFTQGFSFKLEQTCRKDQNCVFINTNTHLNIIKFNIFHTSSLSPMFNSRQPA